MKNSSSENKPLLVFDGECAFCASWIERWKIQTCGRVRFEPYQSLDPGALNVPAAEFQKSIYLFEDNRTTRAAEAAFRTQVYAGNPWLLSAYQFIPGFRALSEKFYSFVASRRSFFFRLTNFLWGKDLRPETYFFSWNIFLKALAVIYAVAFISLYTQIPGLYGPDGILSIAAYLDKMLRYTGNTLASYIAAPSLAWFDAGVPFLQKLCAAGVIFSILLFSGRAVRFSLFCLWVLYLSFVSTGQDFLSFQWDTLLLEAGFLAIFWSPRRKGFLLIFLLFKLMFSSGVVKIVSGDPAWHNLTALNYHYFTQPLPSPVSWFAHQLPEWFDKICAAAMFFIELVSPFFLFFPRRIRMAGVFSIVLLQLVILITGNYCFFNLLTMALCLAAVDDSVWGRRREAAADKTSFLVRVLAVPVAVIFLSVSSAQVARLFRVWLPWTGPALVTEKMLRPFESLNNYGLFAVMTQKRDEIFLEGSEDGKEWKTYEFKYKPGDVNRLPGFVEPFQPRLDWQMWFAALGKVEQNPWFINLCVRLLQGSGDVARLFKANPFPGKPPRYIRASLYEYEFTDLAEKARTGAWWKRTFKGYYAPPLSLTPQENGVQAGENMPMNKKT